MKTTILLTLIFSIFSTFSTTYDNSQLCDLLKTIIDEQYQTSTSSFYQTCEQYYDQNCPGSNDSVILVNDTNNDTNTEDIDYACHYRQMYSPCPPDTPYCHNGKCTDKPDNSNLIK